MTIDEVWTIEYDDVMRYLKETGFELSNPDRASGPAKLPNAAKHACDQDLPERASTFARGELRVCLQQLEPKTLGPIELPGTRVLAECPSENDLSDFYNGFRLRFLKGGG